MAARKKAPEAPAGEQLVSHTGKLTARAKCRLDALADVKGTHAYIVLETAFWAYWEGLPESERNDAETIARIKEKPKK